jgi:hypothetical protein
VSFFAGVSAMNEHQSAPSKKRKAAKVEVNAEAVAAAVEKAVSQQPQKTMEEHQKYLLMKEKRLLAKEKLLCAKEEWLLLKEEKMRKELSGDNSPNHSSLLESRGHRAVSCTYYFGVGIGWRRAAKKNLTLYVAELFTVEMRSITWNPSMLPVVTCR